MALRQAAAAGSKRCLKDTQLHREITVNTYQQWEMFHLNHQERLQEAEMLRLSKLCEKQPSWLGKLVRNVRQRLAAQHAAQPNPQPSLNLAQPE